MPSRRVSGRARSTCLPEVFPARRFRRPASSSAPATSETSFPEALRLAGECRPCAVMLENVRGLLDPKFAAYRRKIERRFRALEYESEWKLLQRVRLRRSPVAAEDDPGRAARKTSPWASNGPRRAARRAAERGRPPTRSPCRERLGRSGELAGGRAENRSDPGRGIEEARRSRPWPHARQARVGDARRRRSRSRGRAASQEVQGNAAADGSDGGSPSGL